MKLDNLYWFLTFLCQITNGSRFPECGMLKILAFRSHLSDYLETVTQLIHQQMNKTNKSWWCFVFKYLFPQLLLGSKSHLHDVHPTKKKSIYFSIVLSQFLPLHIIIIVFVFASLVASFKDFKGEIQRSLHLSKIVIIIVYNHHGPI